MGNWLEDRIRRMSQEEGERTPRKRRKSLELEEKRREDELGHQRGRDEERARNEALRQKLNGVLEKHGVYSLLRDVKSALGGGKIIDVSRVYSSGDRLFGSAALALVFWRDTRRFYEGVSIGGDVTHGSTKQFSVDCIVLYMNSGDLNNLYLYTGILHSRDATDAFSGDNGMFSNQKIRYYLTKESYKFPKKAISITGGTDYEISLRLKDELAKDVFQRQRVGRVPQRSIKNGNLLK